MDERKRRTQLDNDGQGFLTLHVYNSDDFELIKKLNIKTTVKHKGYIKAMRSEVGIEAQTWDEGIYTSRPTARIGARPAASQPGISQLTISSPFTCHFARPLDSVWTRLVMNWADGT